MEAPHPLLQSAVTAVHIVDMEIERFWPGHRRSALDPARPSDASGARPASGLESVAKAEQFEWRTPGEDRAASTSLRARISSASEEMALQALGKIEFGDGNGAIVVGRGRLKDSRIEATEEPVFGLGALR
jgi:hypothetical protein